MDGFTQKDIENHHLELKSYSLLATLTSQFRPKPDDPTQAVVLPAWHFNVLKKISLETKLFVDKSTWNAMAAYFYFGGSVREFFRDEKSMKDHVDNAVREVIPGKQEILVIGGYGGLT